jgi:hypothetical protein
VHSHRLQIHITSRQHLLLRDESARTGLPIAELVRRSIDAAFRPRSRPQVRGWQLNFGLFRDPDAAIVARRYAPPKPELYDDIR